MTLRQRVRRIEARTGVNRPLGAVDISEAIELKALEMFSGDLAQTMDPADLAILDELQDEEEASRWLCLLRRVIGGHDQEGRPLALPHAAFEALRANPRAVLGCHDCSDCGLKAPELWGPTGTGDDYTARPLLSRCPLCGGPVEYEGFIRRAHCLPDGSPLGTGAPWWAHSKAAAQLKAEGVAFL